MAIHMVYTNNQLFFYQGGGGGYLFLSRRGVVVILFLSRRGVVVIYFISHMDCYCIIVHVSVCILGLMLYPIHYETRHILRRNLDFNIVSIKWNINPFLSVVDPLFISNRIHVCNWLRQNHFVWINYLIMTTTIEYLKHYQNPSEIIIPS